MPYVHFIAARQFDPPKAGRFRTKAIVRGVSAIIQINVKPTRVQSLRFDTREGWTVPTAKYWLQKNGFKINKIENVKNNHYNLDRNQIYGRPFKTH